MQLEKLVWENEMHRAGLPVNRERVESRTTSSVRTPSTSIYSNLSAPPTFPPASAFVATALRSLKQIVSVSSRPGQLQWDVIRQQVGDVLQFWSSLGHVGNTSVAGAPRSR